MTNRTIVAVVLPHGYKTVEEFIADTGAEAIAVFNDPWFRKAIAKTAVIDDVNAPLVPLPRILTQGGWSDD